MPQSDHFLCLTRINERYIILREPLFKPKIKTTELILKGERAAIVLHI